MTLQLRSHAKINWHLEVLRRRADGYHELATLFQTIALADEIEIDVRRHGVELEVESSNAGGSIPVDESNLAWRAAQLFLDRYPRAVGGVSLRLRKRIPAGGGLGGGSSNAAAVLAGLARLTRSRPPLAELEELAAEIGADVPYFLHGGVAVGEGRGDRIRPLADDGIEEEEIWLALSPFAVSTKLIFGAHVANTNTEPSRAFAIWSAGGLPRRLSRLGGRNDLAATCFRLHPEIGRVYNLLTASEAAWVGMSGSGGTLVAAFDSPAAAERAGGALPANVSWLPSRTLRRASWREASGF